jgi:hypothetical protein
MGFATMDAAPTITSLLLSPFKITSLSRVNTSHPLDYREAVSLSILGIGRLEIRLASSP